AEMLLSQKHRERALAAMRQMIDRETDDVDSLIEFVDWLVRNKAWEVVDDVARRFDRTFAANARLLYTLAQARQIQGNDKLAEQFALDAFRLNANAEDVAARAELADELRHRGMLAWSEREYRYILAHGTAGSKEVIDARFDLCEMLHDLDRDG